MLPEPDGDVTLGGGRKELMGQTYRHKVNGVPGDAAF